LLDINIEGNIICKPKIELGDFSQ